MKSKEAWDIVHQAEQSGDPEEGLNALLRSHPRWEVRTKAARDLGFYDAVEDTAPLLGALNDKSESVRKRAIITCGRLKIQASVPILCQTLKGIPGRDVAISIIKALAMLGDKQGGEAIIAYLAHWEKVYFGTARIAAEAIGWIVLTEHGIGSQKYRFRF